MPFNREWKTFRDTLAKVSSTGGKDSLEMVAVFALVGREEVPDRAMFQPRVREIGSIGFEFQRW